MERPSASSIAVRIYLLILLTLPILAVCYYFVIALPSYNRQKLALDRQQFLARQQAIQAEQAATQARLQAEEEDRRRQEQAATAERDKAEKAAALDKRYK